MTLTKAVKELMAELQRTDITEEEKKALAKYQHWLFGIRKTVTNNTKGIEWHPYLQEKPTEGTYLLTCEDVDGAPDLCFADYKYGRWIHCPYHDSDIKAWAYPPKPYEEEL